MKPKPLTLLFGMFCGLWTVAVADAPDAREKLHIRTTPAGYDSIVASWKANAVSETFDNYARDFIGLDTSRFLPALSTVTETVCRQRLKTIVSPIHLPYNEIVRKQIAAYTTTHKALTRRMLTYCRYYFPIFERELEKNGLPLELKFLPVIESALQPTATSPAGAAGLWQFRLVTGRYYGLEISSMVDARRDPVASTQAACRYLKDLYDMFDDWTLALASYNYGPGNVIKALKRAGGKASTYWDIYPYLPQATRDYIPALVAMTYLYHYYPDYGITPNDPPIPLATDTVMIDRHLHLDQVAEALGIPEEMIRLLNPQYKQGIIPATIKPYPLVLPQREISRFIDCQSALFARNDDNDEERLNGQKQAEYGQTGEDYKPKEPVGTKYKVKKGDTLGAIAKRYGTTVKGIMRRNNLPDTRLRIGQILYIGK